MENLHIMTTPAMMRKTAEELMKLASNLITKANEHDGIVTSNGNAVEN